MDVVCGAVAGVATRLYLHPLDTVKTVTIAAERSASPLATARCLYRREGITAFYRGIGIASLGAAPGVALHIVGYEHSKRLLVRLTGKTSDAPQVHLAAGLMAETMSCAAWLPSEIVKERLQAQGPEVKQRYRNSIDGIVRVAHLEGVRGLYKGYFLTLSCFGPFSACYFAMFEQLKRHVFGLDASTTPSASQSFFCGAVANGTACAMTQPLEVVKTRYQIQGARLSSSSSMGGGATCASASYSGLCDGITKITRNEGVRGLWRGTLSRAAYTVPSAALTFSLYAKLKAVTNSWSVDVPQIASTVQRTAPAVAV